MSSAPEAMLDTLIRDEVLAEDEEGLRKTDTYRDYRESVADRFEEFDEAHLPEVLDNDEVASLEQTAELALEGVIDYVALTEQCGDDLDKGERAWMTLAIDCIPPDAVPIAGSPEAFTPIQPQKVPFAQYFIRKFIVYVWRDDCDPCDLVREDFDEFYGEEEPDMGLFSTYGPDGSKLLYEEYDVGGGPTTLFFVDGRIDIRLIGAQQPSVLEHTIEEHRELH